MLGCPGQQLGLSWRRRLAAGGVETPAGLEQGLGQGRILQQLRQHGQGQVSPLIGLALAPVQQNLLGGWGRRGERIAAPTTEGCSCGGGRPAAAQSGA